MSKGLYIRVNNTEDFKKEVIGAMLCEYMFDFPNRKSCPYPTLDAMFSAAKKFYHGNSKLLLRLFYNDITREYEMRITTATVEKSYPQIDKLNIYNPEDVDCFVLREIFGEYIPTVDRKAFSAV